MDGAVGCVGGDRLRGAAFIAKVAAAIVLEDGAAGAPGPGGDLLAARRATACGRWDIGATGSHTAGRPDGAGRSSATMPASSTGTAHKLGAGRLERSGGGPVARVLDADQRPRRDQQPRGDRNGLGGAADDDDLSGLGDDATRRRRDGWQSPTARTPGRTGHPAASDQSRHPATGRSAAPVARSSAGTARHSAAPERNRTRQRPLLAAGAACAAGTRAFADRRRHPRSLGRAGEPHADRTAAPQRTCPRRDATPRSTPSPASRRRAPPCSGRCRVAPRGGGTRAAGRPARSGPPGWRHATG